MLELLNQKKKKIEESNLHVLMRYTVWRSNEAKQFHFLSTLSPLVYV